MSDRTSARRAFAAMLLVGAAVTTSVAAVPRTAPAPPGHSSTRDLAQEVCEPMVHDAIESAIGSRSITRQRGRWQGTRFSCRYDVGNGSIVLQVDVEQDRAVATDAFARARAASAPGERLNGLGDRAFQTRAGLFVARKDRFVLRIDPSRLPDGADRHSVAFAAAEAVMSCWKG